MNDSVTKGWLADILHMSHLLNYEKIFILIFCFFTFSNSLFLLDRIKDMASIAGVRTNQLCRYGLCSWFS